MIGKYNKGMVEELAALVCNKYEPVFLKYLRQGVITAKIGLIYANEKPASVWINLPQHSTFPFNAALRNLADLWIEKLCTPEEIQEDLDDIESTVEKLQQQFEALSNTAKLEAMINKYKD